MSWHDVGDRIEVHGEHYEARYEARPETGACDGCAGVDPTVCLALPLGCSLDRIVWVKVPLNPAVGTTATSEQIKPPVSNPTEPHDCPSKAYKPVHGGYPDARPQKGVTD